MIPNRESIEWGRQKAKELEDTPFYMDAVKLHVLVRYAEELQCIAQTLTEIADSDDHEKAMLGLVELADKARELLK